MAFPTLKQLIKKCEQDARHKGQARVSQSEHPTRLFVIMNEKCCAWKFLSPARTENYLDYLK